MKKIAVFGVFVLAVAIVLPVASLANYSPGNSAVESNLTFITDGSPRPPIPPSLAFDGSPRPPIPPTVIADGSPRPPIRPAAAFDGSPRPPIPPALSV